MASDRIYGSIMLKICVYHFFTKLHRFFTFEGGKSKNKIWAYLIFRDVLFRISFLERTL